MTILAEMVKSIADLAKTGNKSIERIEARDRVYLANHSSGVVNEVQPRNEDTAPHLETVQVVRVRSVADWAKAFLAGATGEVRLSRKGETVAASPRFTLAHEKRERVVKPFFAEFLPSGEWQSLEAFMAWIDRIRPGMSEDMRELVDVAFGSVSATSSQVVELSVDGAVINAEVKGGEKVSGRRPLPRSIVSTVPFGDPEHKYACRFIVSARIKDGGVAFRAVHDPNDGAYDAWVAWAESGLRSELPEGWVILLTP